MNNNKVIDLSHVINENVTVFPGMELPIFNNIEIDGYREKKITMYSHTATHIDAPYHVIKNSKTLDEFPIDKFFGKALMIDCKALSGQRITAEFLMPHEEKIRQSRFVIFNSGWSHKWKSPTYFKDFPTLDAAAATYLTTFGLNGIGLDSISLDAVDDDALPNHHIVLSHDILIVENLCNLDAIMHDEFIFQCFPLKIEKADGSPIRAVAIV